MNNKQSLTRFSKILWVLLIILGSVGLLYWISNSNTLQRTDNIPHDVMYIVKGNAGIALVSYTKSNGAASDSEFVSLPWRMPQIRYFEPTMVVLTAHNSTQFGEVECIIMLDGEEWVQDRATAPQLNAACGGVVP